MTFNENDVNREQDGKFGAKTGWPPDPSVTLGASNDLDKLGAKALRAGNRSGDKRYHITDGDQALIEELVTALRDNEPDDAFIEATEKFAERLEDSNFHSAVRRLDTAVTEAVYRADPTAPIKNPAATMQVSKNLDLVRAAEAEYHDRLHSTYLGNGLDAETSAQHARDRTDNNLVYNPNLDDEMVQALSARVTGWQRDELRSHYPDLKS